MPTVFIKTYGCQMNERDSEAVAALFIAHGFSIAESEASADVVLLNTCSVRDTAEQKALGKMRQLVMSRTHARRRQVLGFLGCMAQCRGEELLGRIPGVNLVLGTHKLHRAPEYVQRLIDAPEQPICDVEQDAEGDRLLCEHLTSPDGQAPAVTAFVTIMQGCNRRCAFCIVPSTRGRERSRPMAEIVAECRTLAERGVREVTLLGQIVNNYGRTNREPGATVSPFVRLLEEINAVNGIERIRFTSPHPTGFSDDLIEAFGRLSKLCEHVHLPLQSGSNHVLRQMRRGYTREQYIKVIAKLRQVQPEIGISTDLIVGFPGETEADFEETLQMVEEVQFDSAFVFKYSPRRGTAAENRTDLVPGPAIAERHARLLSAVNKVAEHRFCRMIGKTVEVLVEGPSRRNPARLEGRTRCNKIVVFSAGPGHVGQLLNVNITRASAVTLYGDAAVTDRQTA
ncbi:MAG: tRNA (N6-isopentenyl adenosine(37)-C2)-methylthiotransferase MiaB [Verrucomicrobia bacterium]|nr:tRNA (N6-isopentenyl adenosine(37)-C2)-methylthiotransferase MiaB [Verrucomicrobiota bacterium]